MSFLDRETDVVRVFNADNADWIIQNERLPKPLFSHGCNMVTLKDGRNGILTVGGFTTEGIPAVTTFENFYRNSNILTDLCSYFMQWQLIPSTQKFLDILTLDTFLQRLFLHVI